VSEMTIGELARRTGLAVRTLRFYADAGVLPEAARSESGYRLFGPDAVARARLLRTLRELGVGLEDIKRVLAAEIPLSEIADRHARALDAQIRTLRLQRAVLRAVATSTNAEELQRMTDLTSMTADERRRILDDYLDAVFGDHDSPVAERLRTGAPELPDDPTADQVAAWVELVELLRDPDYIESSRRMAERARTDGAAPDGRHETVEAIEQQARAAVQAGLAPDSPEALAVIERVEALTPGRSGDRLELAERLETFTDRRVFRYWTLVGIVNGWPQARTTGVVELFEAWEWYSKALRAQA
jgi:DNA-binding transcriptional MerR regulator